MLILVNYITTLQDFLGGKSFYHRESKEIISKDQKKECCGILVGFLIWLIALLPVILSWTLLIYNPQRPLVWGLAKDNDNVAVAIKVCTYSMYYFYF